MVFRFWPYTFTPTSVRMPVLSILMRLMMGWVQPLTTPGIWSLPFISSISLALVIPSRHCSRGLSRMMVSIMLMGELSVAELARPALPSTLSTSGTCLIILSCTCRMRFISVFDTSGWATGMNRMEPSFSGGMNSVPRLMIKGMLMSSNPMLMASVVLRQRITQCSIGEYTRSRKRLSGFCSSVLNLPFRKKEISTGASVTASRASIIRMKLLVQASGWKSLPSCPVSRNTGKKDVTMMMVEKKIPRDTCLLEDSMMSSRFWLSMLGGS